MCLQSFFGSLSTAIEVKEKRAAVRSPQCKYWCLYSLPLSSSFLPFSHSVHIDIAHFVEEMSFLQNTRPFLFKKKKKKTLDLPGNPPTDFSSSELF